jgi:hypothetical protein
VNEEQVWRIHERGRPVRWTDTKGKPLGCQHDRLAPMLPDFVERICMDCGETTYSGDDIPVPPQ